MMLAQRDCKHGAFSPVASGVIDRLWEIGYIVALIEKAEVRANAGKNAVFTRTLNSLAGKKWCGNLF